MIEARTYRRGAHSSSDDPSVYRDPGRAQGVGAAATRSTACAATCRRAASSPPSSRRKARAEINAGDHATRSPTPSAARPSRRSRSLFEDVYAEPTPRLREQPAELEAEIAKHGPKRPPHG